MTATTTRRKTSRRKGAPAAAPGTTGRELRQQIPTPPGLEFRSVLAKVGTIEPDPEVQESIFGLVVLDRPSMFDDDEVRDIIKMIDWTGLPEWVQGKIDAAKTKPGRPHVLSIRALMVGLLLAPIDCRGLLLTEVAEILHHRIRPAVQAELGISPVTPSGDPPRRELRARAAEHGRVQRAFARLRAVMDPSVHRKGRVMPWTELVKHDRVLSEDEQIAQQATLDMFVNTLVAATYAALPEEVLEHYDGSAGVDATPMRLWARMRGVDSPTAASDPDGGVYQRTGDHSEKPLRPGQRRRLTDVAYFAMDAHLMVSFESNPGARQYMPGLALAVTLDRPGIDPGGAARRLISILAERGHTPGYLAGDGLYTNQDPEMFQIVARQAGWKLVLPYGVDQTGKQATDTSGAVMVDGAWMCPAVTDDLADATARYRAKEITLDEYQAAIRKRNDYLMRLHAQDPAGEKIRMRCPAAGDAPTARCVLKPRSEESRPVAVTADGHKFDGRPRIVPGKNIDRDHPPKVCTAQTITISTRTGAKYAQSMDLTYGSPEHARTYNALRQTQEGIHGFAKDDAKEALASAGKRRVHGKAAQSIFAGFILAAANLRKIRRFLQEAEYDDAGRPYVPRSEWSRARAENPPGAAPPEP